MKGWIALDIDGTITTDKYSVPAPVVDYLRELESGGWKIVIATGRSFLFASIALSSFDFPYTFLVQNGSAALQMPNRELIFKKYLTSSSIDPVEKIFDEEGGGILVYSGYERGDACYYNPKKLSQSQIEYVYQLQAREKEPPRPILSSFHDLVDIALIKGFGSKEQMARVAQKLFSANMFQISLIRDPFEEDGFLLLITDRQASKGSSLKKILEKQGRGEKVIAAGDDENDESLLKEADVKIAMAQAPDSLKKLADWIAAPASELGIIPALQWAVQYGC